MADFIRPELKASLWRFRDALIGAGVSILALWMIFAGRGFVPWLGYVVLALGVVMSIAGVQRARFRQGDDGPGVVQIAERRLAYFGPLDGGTVDLENIAMLAFEPVGYPVPHWIVTGPENRDLAIPITARGAEALFDTFSALPGMRTEQLLSVLQDRPAQRVVIWSRPRHLLH